MIAWFTKNSVAANLLAFGLIAAGLYPVMTDSIPVEFFPSSDPEVVSVTVPYRGSTPVEVEEAVVVRIEEAVQDLEGIRKITSTANEGSGTVRIEVLDDYDPRRILEDVKNRVNTINTFPTETENPQISLAQRTFPSITITLSGDISERALRVLGERVREEVLAIDGITQVSLTGVRPYEIGIELRQEILEEYGLSFADVSNAIQRSSLDLAAGSIKTEVSEILLRTKGQAYDRADFENIVIRSDSQGTVLRVKDVAVVRDGFSENPSYTTFNGKPAVFIQVASVGRQNILTIAEKVKTYAEERVLTMPSGVTMDTWQDRSRVVDARLTTLLSSAVSGGLLVFTILTLFLRPSLAIWVCFGIPISFLGALALMPWLDATINIISLFGFILVLGIVVDDAIVTGESIFTRIQEGMDPEQAAIVGTKDVAAPVTFGVLTTMVAFLPLFLMSAGRGPIWAQIPLIIIPVLAFSLVESKLILPAHLKHVRVGHDRSKMNFLMRLQRAIADGLERFVRKVYQPFLKVCLKNRYITMSVFIFLAMCMFGVFSGGKYLRFVFFPRVETEYPSVSIAMPLGTAPEITQAHVESFEEEAMKLQEKYTDPESGKQLIQVVSSSVGATRPGRGSGQSHLGGLSFQLLPPEERTGEMNISGRQLLGELRRNVGPIPGIDQLSFRDVIAGGGLPIDVQLMGPSFDELSQASREIQRRLREYDGLYDINDTFQNGKQEIQLALKPEAEAFGITLNDLTRQVRQAFFGLEAQRIQRGRDDIRVMVRYPLEDRRSLEDLDNLKVRTPAGGEVPFETVAYAEMSRGFSEITRIDRSRTINVTADIDQQTHDLEPILADMVEWIPEVISAYPGMRYSLEGEQEERRDSMNALFQGIIIVLVAVYALMAIPTKSYTQPLIVLLTVLPFCVAGAMFGHMVMGGWSNGSPHISGFFEWIRGIFGNEEFSGIIWEGKPVAMLSYFGMLALVGVAINDSIVMLDYINKKRLEGMSAFDAIFTAGGARFRAIILTSLTTFFGLTPIIFEKSTQAQFLIPMAISLGFGIVLTTFITLILLPTHMMIAHDLGTAIKKAWRWYWTVGEKRDEDEVIEPAKG